jgi:hypothetical protein
VARPGLEEERSQVIKTIKHIPWLLKVSAWANSTAPYNNKPSVRKYGIQSNGLKLGYSKN